ncbi:MAG: hypothetical protein LBH65_03110, partial [Desulfovibrio sp.]|nr:hypothetical protein [Desulfovibrio sp.]
MNINFHYFAVKTIASFVGVPEPQAQSLALYSQYVDDYDLYAPFTIADVPAYAQHLARKHTNGKNWTFYPITTGFNRWDTMLRLLLVSNQRAITIPFHFITAQPLKSYPDTTSRELYRTQAASLEKASLIQAMLFAAKCEYLRAPDACNLMRIGILIHIFADTYAHQHFSGFHGWENDSRVTKAIDTHYKKDLTSKFKKWPCDKLPALGHTNVWHTPDETYLEFEIQQKLNKSDKGHHLNLNRSNTQVFAEAANQIGLFLTDCFRLPQKNDKEWNKFISRLRNGFFITELDSPTLSRKWAAKFPGYEYYYDYKKI